MNLMFNLGDNPDLSKSYVFLQTAGEVSAIFTIDALVKANFDSKEFPLATLPFPGASFSVPKLLTVGPKFVLNAQAEAEIQLAGHLETKVEIASWNFRQTYPQQTSEFDPKSLDDPQRDFDLKGLQQPMFNASVVAEGQITAHLRPTLSFGIEFDKRWEVPKLIAELVAHGWVRGRAKANILGGDAATCPFQYGLDAGAVLTARANAPPQFKWATRSMDFFPIEKNLVPGDGSEWKCVGGATSRRSIDGRDAYLGIDTAEMESDFDLMPANSRSIRPESSLIKRGPTYGPFFHIPAIGKLCPMTGGGSTTACKDIKGWTDDQLNDPTLDTKRRSIDVGGKRLISSRHEAEASGLVNDTTSVDVDDRWNSLEKRGGAEQYHFCEGDAKMNLQGAAGLSLRDLARQMLKIFIDRVFKDQPNTAYKSQCKYLQAFWVGPKSIIQNKMPWDYVAQAFPNNDANGNEMVILEEEINLSKERAFKSGVALNDVAKMTEYTQNFEKVNIAIKNLKNAILAVTYMRDQTINDRYKTQADRVGDRLAEAETLLQAKWKTTATPYTPLDMKGQWSRFIRDYTTEVIDKFEEFLNLWSGGHLSKWVPPDGSVQQTKAQMTLTEKLIALRAEVEAVTGAGLFPNPFPVV
ncbi:hypothetical protein F4808DRAFT_468777 [Astrocystis sublimbata]|nr:hypothetical protein F4808DRAFT_468777 [Astrocystis sublimbata]